MNRPLPKWAEQLVNAANCQHGLIEGAWLEAGIRAVLDRVDATEAKDYKSGELTARAFRSGRESVRKEIRGDE